MKKLIIYMAMALLCPNAAISQNPTLAKKVLDKTASVVGKKDGASAKFTITQQKVGSSTGNIYIKGNKFHATTPEAIVWFDGKTQWSYMKNTDEVNITTPTKAQQMAMNPYTFINMYKSGYQLGITQKEGNYVAHLTAQSKQSSIQEMYITISKTTYIPSLVKMRQKESWTTIVISNFSAKSLKNDLFTFNPKAYPSAEVIDLR